MTDIKLFMTSAVPYLPVLITIIGWWMVNRQANRRETRKEMRALVDNCKKEVGRVASDAAFYRKSADSPLAPQIKDDLQALETEFERIPGFSKNTPVFVAFTAFADAATGGDFEQISRQAVDQAHPTILNIARARHDLVARLEIWFRGRYPDAAD